MATEKRISVKAILYFNKSDYQKIKEYSNENYKSLDECLENIVQDWWRIFILNREIIQQGGERLGQLQKDIDSIQNRTNSPEYEFLDEKLTTLEMKRLVKIAI